MSQLDRTKAPAIHSVGNLTLPYPTRSLTLDNGIPLSVYDGGEAEVSRLSVVIDGGTFEVEHPSLLRLMHSMVKDGADGKTGEELANIFDYNGAWVGNSCDHHFSRHQLFSLNHTFGEVAPVFASMLATPSFPQHEFEVRRDKAALQLEEEMQQVSFRASLCSDKMFYGPHNPACHFDTPGDVRALTRQMAEDLYHKAFSPSSLHLYLSGRITPEMEDIVNRSFAFEGLNSPGLGFTKVQPCPVSVGTVEKDSMPNSRQSAVEAFIPVEIGRNHPDYVPLHTVVTVLGGYFGSRLMLNIRESKGLTYGIYAALEGVFDVARITVSTQCDAANVDPVIEEVKKEMARLADPATYTPDEIARVRSYLSTRLLGLLDSPFSIQDYHIFPLVLGMPDNYFEQRLQALNTLSPQMAADIAAKYINPEKLRVALAGK